MRDQVLIVEDDRDIARLVQVHLSELSLESHHVGCAESALSYLENTACALVLLDIMLPTMDGLTLCRKLKDSSPETSVVLLTSRSAEMDRVIGLEMGADDYICKPFNTRELQARVKAQLRHVHLLRNKQQIEEVATIVTLGPLLINQQSRDVFIQRETLNLTSTEFDLLIFFASHPNQVFSRTQLLDSVWGYQHSGYEHTVNSHINRLRAKLEPYQLDNVIETVWGVGYKLNPSTLTCMD
ncbi:response regulator transcription factor [Colwellia sp. D2M02]|uniref:Response regulator transcription factor n=1 Tax=Colwellia asteriadis TaxID=517723 RepID=A0ABP3WH79_9GAMM|nr:response regulator transcription factor [Colwellia sp. D2M02]MBU2891720.1 response regulator transcription factor [Colwellia sp. D2M02]